MEISTNAEVQNKILSIWTEIQNFNATKLNHNHNENQQQAAQCFIENLIPQMPILNIDNDPQLSLNWQYGPNQPNADFIRCDPYAGTMQVKEMVNWLIFNQDEKITNVISEQMSKNNFTDWIEIGERKNDIANETKYCNPDVLRKVIEAKEIFDELDPYDLSKARSRANPFETVKSAFFMNRAALKMANIDAATDFLFTGIDKQEEHKQLVRPYYFADICAGPGSFSEYIFWRKKWAFKGFGITLRGENDFKLYESSCAPSETFEPLYGVRDDGNVYYPENIQDFCTKIKMQTNGEGVHFIMGDGGFSVEGQENIQEILSKQLYACQCFIALSALRTYGHFVVKLFDLFTEFSVGLVFLMHLCFNKVAVFKPNASRPANSERYLICCKKKPDEEIVAVREYLKKIVHTFLEIRNNTEDNLDINRIVPETIINNNAAFVEYMTSSNNSLAKKQTAALMKLGLFCRDSALIEPRQEELRKLSLAFWHIPDKPKKPWSKLTINKLIYSTVRIPKDIFSFTYTRSITYLEELQTIFEKPENWHYTYVSSSENCSLCTLYIGLGLNKVYKYFNKRWVKVDDVELIRGTILYAEIVNEYLCENETIIKQSLHVIDALRLGDLSLADLPYLERKELINNYCQAVNKESRVDLVTIRSKTPLPIVEVSTSKFSNFIQNGEYLCTLDSINENMKWKFVAKSLLLLQTDLDQYFCNTVSSGRLINIPTIFDIETQSYNFYLWNCFMQLSEINK